MYCISISFDVNVFVVSYYLNCSLNILYILLLKFCESFLYFIKLFDLVVKKKNIHYWIVIFDFRGIQLKVSSNFFMVKRIPRSVRLWLKSTFLYLLIGPFVFIFDTFPWCRWSVILYKIPEILFLSPGTRTVLSRHVGFSFRSSFGFMYTLKSYVISTVEFSEPVSTWIVNQSVNLFLFFKLGMEYDPFSYLRFTQSLDLDLLLWYVHDLFFYPLKKKLDPCSFPKD